MLEMLMGREGMKVVEILMRNNESVVEGGEHMCEVSDLVYYSI